MAISIRANEEQERRYREYAAQHGMSVSEFMRKCADDVIAQAQRVLQQAEEQRRHEQEVADFKRRFDAFLQTAEAVPSRDLTDEELAELRVARHA